MLLLRGYAGWSVLVLHEGLGRNPLLHGTCNMDSSFEVGRLMDWYFSQLHAMQVLIGEVVGVCNSVLMNAYFRAHLLVFLRRHRVHVRLLFSMCHSSRLLLLIVRYSHLRRQCLRTSRLVHLLADQYDRAIVRVTFQVERARPRITSCLARFRGTNILAN